jgi:hypothetical protein
MRMKLFFRGLADYLLVIALVFAVLALPSCMEHSEPMTTGASCLGRVEPPASDAEMRARLRSCDPHARARSLAA